MPRVKGPTDVHIVTLRDPVTNTKWLQRYPDGSVHFVIDKQAALAIGKDTLTSAHVVRAPGLLLGPPETRPEDAVVPDGCKLIRTDQNGRVVEIDSAGVMRTFAYSDEKTLDRPRTPVREKSADALKGPTPEKPIKFAPVPSARVPEELSGVTVDLSLEAYDNFVEVDDELFERLARMEKELEGLESKGNLTLQAGLAGLRKELEVSRRGPADTLVRLEDRVADLEDLGGTVSSQRGKIQALSEELARAKQVNERESQVFQDVQDSVRDLKRQIKDLQAGLVGAKADDAEDNKEVESLTEKLVDMGAEVDGATQTIQTDIPKILLSMDVLRADLKRFQEDQSTIGGNLNGISEASKALATRMEALSGLVNKLNAGAINAQAQTIAQETNVLNVAENMAGLEEDLTAELKGISARLDVVETASKKIQTVATSLLAEKKDETAEANSATSKELKETQKNLEALGDKLSSQNTLLAGNLKAVEAELCERIQVEIGGISALIEEVKTSTLKNIGAEAEANLEARLDLKVKLENKLETARATLDHQVKQMEETLANLQREMCTGRVVLGEMLTLYVGPDGDLMSQMEAKGSAPRRYVQTETFRAETELSAGDIVGINRGGSVEVVSGGAWDNPPYVYQHNKVKSMYSRWFETADGLVLFAINKKKLRVNLFTKGQCLTEIVDLDMEPVCCDAVCLDREAGRFAVVSGGGVEQITLRKLRVQVTRETDETTLQVTVEGEVEHKAVEDVAIEACSLEYENSLGLDILVLVTHDCAGALGCGLFKANGGNGTPMTPGYAIAKLCTDRTCDQGKSLKTVLLPAQTIVCSYGNYKVLIMLSDSETKPFEVGVGTFDNDSVECVDLLYDPAFAVIMSLEQTIGDSAIIRVFDTEGVRFKRITSKKVSMLTAIPVGMAYNTGRDQFLLVFADDNTDGTLNAQIFTYDGEKVTLGPSYGETSLRYRQSAGARVKGQRVARIGDKFVVNVMTAGGDFACIYFDDASGIPLRAYVGFSCGPSPAGGAVEVAIKGQVFVCPQALEEKWVGRRVYARGVKGKFRDRLSLSPLGNVFVGTCLSPTRIQVGL
jgi:hypothetical protein